MVVVGVNTVKHREQTRSMHINQRKAANGGMIDLPEFSHMRRGEMSWCSGTAQVFRIFVDVGRQALHCVIVSQTLKRDHHDIFLLEVMTC